MKWSEVTIDEQVREIEERMRQAEEAGFIHNVDFQALKERLNRTLETAEDPIGHCYFGGRAAWTPKSADRGIPYAHTIPGLRRRVASDLAAFEGRKDRLGKDREPIETMLGALAAFTERFEPLCLRLEAIKATVRMGRKPSDDPTRTPSRTLEHTGTCAICRTNVKRDAAGNLHHHGFTIPGGWGERNGGCFGTRRQPVEVSDEALRAVLELGLRPRAKALAKALAEVASDAREVYPHPRRPDYTPSSLETLRRWHEEFPNVPRGDALFEAARAKTRRDLEADAERVRDQIAEVEGLVAAWRPARLPDETPEAFAARVG